VVGDGLAVGGAGRERFGFVFPGETPYVVVDENGNPLDESGALRDPAPPDPQVPTAWWSTAWQSVELAGKPAGSDQ